MDNIQNLIKEGNHQAILDLEGDSYNAYKAVAAIHLGQFSKALEFVETGSYEHAYILYRIKKFKKSLKLLKDRDDKKSDILRSQCLYNLGYYAEAYDILKKHGSADEYAVNLGAMESLAHLNEKNRFRPSIFATPYRSSIHQKINPSFSDKYCNMEYEYAMLFKLVEDEELFLRELQKLDEKWNIPGSCIKKQISNLTGEIVENPTEREKEVIRFNSGDKNAITNPVHYQLNFTDDNSTEYAIFKECQNTKGEALYGSKNAFCKKVDGKMCHSDKLKILSALTYLKSSRSEKTKQYVHKIMSSCGDCIQKEAILAMINLDGSKTQSEKAANVLDRLRQE